MIRVSASLAVFLAAWLLDLDFMSLASLCELPGFVGRQFMYVSITSSSETVSKFFLIIKIG